MIAVVQRVSEAEVEVAEAGHTASIGRGLCVLLGVEQGDSRSDAQWMAAKLARLRIFPDEVGKMNRSVQEIGGEMLLISQFTLAGDCAHGNRPSFTNAAAPEIAEPLYEHVAALLREEHHLPVRTGVFGGMMSVRIVNEGPVTLIVRTRD
jgi:D-tyrosyl-tRNA(Tyr) deacylase